MNDAAPPPEAATRPKRARLARRHGLGLACGPIGDANTLSGKLLGAIGAQAIVSLSEGDGRIIYANDRLCAISGYARAELTGRDLRQLESGQHPQAFHKALPDALFAGQVWNGEFTILAKHGARYQLSTTIVPLQDGRGRPDRLLWICTDITPDRPAVGAPRTRRPKSDLNRAVAQAPDPAWTAQQSSKAAYLAKVTHEIRTPLYGIAGLVSLAINEPDGSPQMRKYLGKLKGSVASLASLANDVLDLARLESARLNFERIPFDLHQLLRTLQDEYLELARERGIELTLDLARDVPRVVLGDPLRVRQVVLNYLTNALKFTPVGTVGIHVEPCARPEGPVDGAALLRLEIRDTGIGLDDKTVANLFDPFSQGRIETSRLFGGSSLGLAICREISEHMGGQVGAYGGPAGGAVFWAELPLMSADPTGPTPAALAAEASDLEGLRILLVDDDEVVQIIVTATLERWGCHVTLARDGREAVRAIKTADTGYDLVLMDLNMSDMGGRQATSLIRRTHSRDALPIVAMTGASDLEERRRCLRLGMNDHLSKPVDEALLRATIGRVCQRERPAASPSGATDETDSSH